MTVAEKKLQAFHLEWDENDVGVLTLDVPGERMNILTPQVFGELREICGELSRRTHLRALVIRSGKRDNFIAGADIKTLEKVRTAEEGEELSRQAQAILNRLAELPFVTVCAIHGPCLGGGLELALATDYRLVSDHHATRLGLPEVRLGLIPGAGGTQRLPRLIGLPAALDLILTGRHLRPRQAHKMGLVDEVVPLEVLDRRAREAALELAEFRGMATDLREGRKKKLSDLLLEQLVVRSALYSKTRAELRKKTGGHYPAPFKALEAAMAATRKPLEEGLALEARLFGEVISTAVSKSLVHLFHLTTRSRALTGLPEGSETKPRTLEKIGILGGGLMGSGIAAVLADKGFTVRIKDRDNPTLGRTLRYAWKVYDRQVQRRRMRPFDRDLRMNRIRPTTDYSGFKKTGFVIEAVFEDLDLKHQVLREVEEISGPDVIFASNTSSIPIAEIARGARRPENVIGMHFFSPVDKMPLVEVIVTAQTSEEAVATTVDLAKKMGKHVIVVGDGTGFYTSRVLGFYVNEAVRLLYEGGAVDAIDRAIVDLGFPVGPFTLLDEVGIGVVSKVMRIMAGAFPETFRPPEGWEEIAAEGRQGKRSGKGFYRYHGKAKEPDTSLYERLPGGRRRSNIPAAAIQERCLMAFLNEAARCLEEGVLRSPHDGDLGAVFGLGFPPFMGGPFWTMDRLGIPEVVRRLRALEEVHGQPFHPAALLVEKAGKGERFYPEG